MCWLTYILNNFKQYFALVQATCGLVTGPPWPMPRCRSLSWTGRRMPSPRKYYLLIISIIQPCMNNSTIHFFRQFCVGFRQHVGAGLVCAGQSDAAISWAGRNGGCRHPGDAPARVHAEEDVPTRWQLLWVCVCLIIIIIYNTNYWGESITIFFTK